MSTLFWILLFVGGGVYLAYRRVSLFHATVAVAAALLGYTIFGDGGALWLLLLWAGFGVMAALNVDELRRSRVTQPLLRAYRRMLPNISNTEREALEAGSVWWDGEIFSGDPDWRKLKDHPAPKLSAEEQAFLDGPTEELCRMLDEWEITHELADLPPSVWQFIKDNGFFAMIIPKEYGGLEFSAYAHSQVLVKISSRSATAASMVAVPNSLGPAELLLHYGTDEQKKRYLPGLAAGSEIPCFGLTAPRAGSDAASIPDSGVVCRGVFEGKEVLGMRLNFEKRYITLAPVATVVGLAFRLQDPEGLMGDPERQDYGITVALIPADSDGVEIGRRHLPIGIPFMNGPIKGTDVFVPLDFIVGGPKMAGQGWRMLVELLSVGRSISLPANAVGGAKAGTFATGAYARIRKQFNTSIGNFEGVQEAVARMAGLTYIADAARSVTVSAIDTGEKPAVPSAILKYHCTEMSRVVANDAMDVQGGKAVCMGPRNYLATGYASVPVMITVEGANILTRSLIIFGQGAIRCHPYVLRELEAARDPDPERGLEEFDRALFGHFGYAITNAARSFVQALTIARYARVPVSGPTRRYYQQITRFSASFALASDVAMLTLGGALKKKEMLSARLGDILSTLYMASTVLKHYENAGSPEADLPLVEWSCRTLLYKAQEQLHAFLRNFPNRAVAAGLRFLIFPRGRTYFSPSDLLARRVVELVINPSASRDRLCAPVYRTLEPGSHLGLLQEAMELSIAITPLEKKLRRAVKEGIIKPLLLAEQITAAVTAGVLTEDEAHRMREADLKIMEIITVDDFDSSELARQQAPPEPKAPKRVARKKKAAARRPTPVEEQEVAAGGG
ncbi:MAG: acyl-CoA dehydrogenase [Gammaproteobacteria bacterium]